MSSSSSLSGLPPELLLITFEYFCPHCHDESKHWIYRDLTLKGGATLLSLCLVSKQLSAVATEVLYHDPAWPLDWPMDVNKTCHLLSTFVIKPHLADHIRRLRLEPTDWYAKRNLGQQRMLNALLDRLDLTPVPKKKDRAADQKAIHKLYRTLMRELLTRSGKLTELSITNEGRGEKTDNEETEDEETNNGETDDKETDDEEMNDYENTAWQRVAAKPHALTSLKRLEVIPGHYMFEGFRFEVGVRLDDTKPTLACRVLEAARNLERLSVQMCMGISFVGTFPSVTSVELLNSSLTDEDLQNLVACFPALREFRYDSGGSKRSKEHKSAHIARYLGPIRSTLTSVSLSYRSNSHTIMDSFRGFPVLESMELHHRDIFNRSEDPPPVDRLVSLLPPSLKRLRIRGHKCTPASEVLSLLIAVAHGQFPALEKVNGPFREFGDLENDAVQAMGGDDSGLLEIASFVEAGGDLELVVGSLVDAEEEPEKELRLALSAILYWKVNISSVNVQNFG